jgi:hypothetical protein
MKLCDARSKEREVTMWGWKLVLASAACVTVMAPAGRTAEHAPESHESSPHYHPQVLELFLGDTYEDGEHGDEHGFTVGLTYEYRFAELFGTGGFVEYACGDFSAWTAGVPLFIHPYKGWRFALAPGLEYKDDEGEFLFRIGVAYEFELSERVVLMPEFNVDFVDGEELYVFGLSFGWGFGS